MHRILQFENFHNCFYKKVMKVLGKYKIIQIYLPNLASGMGLQAEDWTAQSDVRQILQRNDESGGKTILQILVTNSIF